MSKLSTRSAFAIRMGIREEEYGVHHVLPAYFRVGFIGWRHAHAYLRGRGLWQTFWDFDRCPRGYAPIALFYRSKAFVLCALTRHRPIGSWTTTRHGWLHACRCGYRGHFERGSTDCPELVTKSGEPTA